MKNAIINARIEVDLKANAEGILKELGLTATQAITMFYKQIQFNHGLPFDVKIPNKETIEAIKDAKNSNLEIVSLDTLQEQLTK